MDFICFKIPYEYRPCLDLKLKKITPRTRPQIRLYGVKNTACKAWFLKGFQLMHVIKLVFDLFPFDPLGVQLWRCLLILGLSPIQPGCCLITIMGLPFQFGTLCFVRGLSVIFHCNLSQKLIKFYISCDN